MKPSRCCIPLLILVILLLPACDNDGFMPTSNPKKQAQTTPGTASSNAVKTNPKIQDMVFIPSGEFIMGSVDEDVNVDEKPPPSLNLGVCWKDNQKRRA